MNNAKRPSPSNVNQTVQERRLQLERELQRYVDLITTHMQPERILLFGSLAQNSVHAWSDIDLVVIQETQERFLDRSKRLIRLLRPQVG
ncbi:nucleotidyltransferase domain-containing protein, partial [Candidatus Viridilinea mediisalina]|uniref:nucleotidyltransferase domain-containing protein n=1 Tax=Candidatus Viridilinea mediisalina TaxID=2024553 RepID=UPI001FE2AA3B